MEKEVEELHPLIDMILNSKDLDGEIVDMVNRNFKKLLLKMENLEPEISKMVTDNFWDLI